MSTVAEPAADDLDAVDAQPSPWRPAPRERVVIYGAGSFARALVHAVRAAGAVVHYVLDRRGADVGDFDGVPVHRPGEVGLTTAERAALPALVGVFNREADPREIESCLH